MFRKAILMVCLTAALAGCKSETRSTALQAKQKDKSEHHLLKGKVISVDVPRKKVTIEHGDIAGYMRGMTMPFIVENQSELTGVLPGDEVEADLVVANNTSYLQSIDVTKPASGQRSRTEQPRAAHYPQVGESAHDFHLKTQDGKPIALADYQGKPLLVDFIYTQCPLPQFCPLLNVKFAELAHALVGHPPQLLSVSIDPEHDTVPVLKAFSAHFDAVNGGNWNFATGTSRQVHDFASNMGLDYWPESGQVVHSVVVYLIGKDGKIAKIWYGNDWKTQDVLDAMKSSS